MASRQPTDAEVDTATALLVASIERLDPEVSARTRRVVALVERIAQQLGFDEAAIADVRRVAELANVGLLAVPEDLLARTESLDDDERAVLCEAPVAGERMVAGLAGTRHLAPSIRAQRERWDGTGYPDGLAGEAIPRAARIFAVADAWEALRLDRPWRPALSDADAAKVIRSNSGSQFCPIASAMLLELVGAPAEAEPVRAPERRRRRFDASWVVAGALGLLAGLLWALPLEDVRDRCPPAGEGLVQCQLQKSILPAVMIVLGCVAAALVARWLILDKGPRLFRAWRAGELRHRAPAPPPFEDDPVLRAANWGLTYRDAHPDRRVRRGRTWSAGKGDDALRR